MNNWDKTYMRIANEYANHSKCAARKVACVLVKGNNIIGVGVNAVITFAMSVALQSEIEYNAGA